MANDQNLTPFQPGKSGNPGGMKKGTRHLSTLLRDALEKGVEVEIGKRRVTVNEAEVIKQLLKLAGKGSIRAIEQIFDRIDGRVAQPIEHSGSIGNGDLSNYTEQQLIERLHELENGE